MTYSVCCKPLAVFLRGATVISAVEARGPIGDGAAHSTERKRAIDAVVQFTHCHATIPLKI